MPRAQLLETINDEEAVNCVRLKPSGEAGMLGSISPSTEREGVGPAS